MSIQLRVHHQKKAPEVVTRTSLKVEMAVLAPDEIVLQICRELVYHKGIVDIDSFCGIAAPYCQGIQGAENNPFMEFIIGNVLNQTEILLLHNGKEVEDKKEHSPQILLKNTTAYHIKMKEDNLWDLLVGRSYSESNIGAKGFDLLLEIVASRDKGIDVVTLTKRSKQDARSVSGRLKKMEHLLSITPVLLRKHLTKHIVYKGLNAKPKSEALTTPEGQYLSKQSMAVELMKRLKYSKHGLRQILDLKKELGFDAQRSLSRRFMLACNWLLSLGCIKKVVVCSSVNNYRFHCYQYLKDLDVSDITDDSDEEEESDEQAEPDAGEKRDTEIGGLQGDEAALSEGLAEEKLEHMLKHENVIIEEESPNESNHLGKKKLLFNRFYADQSCILDFVQSHAAEGATTMQILNTLFDNLMSRPFFNRLDTLCDEPQDIKKAGNGYRLVKVVDFEGRKKFFRWFGEDYYKEVFLKGTEKTNVLPLPEPFIQKNSLRQLNKSVCPSLPLVVDVVELPDGGQHHIWRHHMDASLKEGKQRKRPLKDLYAELHKEAVDQKKIRSANEQLSERASEMKETTSCEDNVLKMDEYVGNNLRSIQVQRALIAIIKKNDGAYLISQTGFQEDIALEMGVQTLVDRKTMRRDINRLQKAGKIQLVQKDQRLCIALPNISKEKIERLMLKQNTDKSRTQPAKWEVSSRNELTFFDKNQHNRFYESRSMQRIAAYQEKESKEKKTHQASQAKKSEQKMKDSATKQGPKPDLANTAGAYEKLKKGALNIRSREGVDVLLKCCIISQSIKKKIEWSKVHKLFVQETKALQKVFISQKKLLGPDYFKEEQLKWKRVMLSAIRKDLASVEDAETLDLKKLVRLWKNHQTNASNKTKVLYKDIKRNHQKYEIVEEPFPSVFKLSIAKSSMTKRFQASMRKPFTVEETKLLRDDQFEKDEKMKSIVRSLLLDGGNCGVVEIAEKYLQQYTEKELQKVIEGLVKEKVIALNGNSEFYLAEAFNETFAKHNKALFFQNLSNYMETFATLSKEGMGVMLTEEPTSTVVAGCLEMIERNVIKLASIPSFYSPSVDEELDYIGKKTKTQEYEEALIVIKNDHFSADNAIRLLKVPGLGVPYSRIWIDGRGQVRDNIWKSVLSMVLFHTMFDPAITKKALSGNLNKILSLFELDDIITWLLQNKAICGIDGSFDIISSTGQNTVMSGYQTNNKPKEYSLYGSPKVVKPPRESRYKRLVANVLNYFVKSGFGQAYKSSDNGENSTVPGGFFSETSADQTFFDNSALSANPASQLSPNLRQPKGVAHLSSDTYARCNAVLADFFRKKGDEPLSAVEIEGVSAIIRNAQIGDANSKKPHTTDCNGSSVFENTPTTLGTLTQAKESVNDEYNPTYERQNLNVQQQARKRVFDFSAMPAPYHTGVIYKPHDLLKPEKQEKEEEEETTAQFVQLNAAEPNERKASKLSATATTLISLLADNEASKRQQVFQNAKSLKKISIKNQMANPYSNYSSNSPETARKELAASSKIPDFKNVSRNSKQNEMTDLPKDKSKLSVKKQHGSNGLKNAAQPKGSAFTFSFTASSAPSSFEKASAADEKSSVPKVAFEVSAQNKQPEPASNEENSSVKKSKTDNEKSGRYVYNFPDPLPVADNHFTLGNQQVQNYRSMFCF
ncbi:hypothetical protein ACO0QE_002954 [Hanseniaspora vineae]